MKSSLQYSYGPAAAASTALTRAASSAPTAAALAVSVGCSNQYELRFQSLFNEGRAYAFPCDAAGHVDLDALSERARDNYLYARAVVGREVSTPSVRLTDLH